MDSNYYTSRFSPHAEYLSGLEGHDIVAMKCKAQWQKGWCLLYFNECTNPSRVDDDNFMYVHFGKKGVCTFYTDAKGGENEERHTTYFYKVFGESPSPLMRNARREFSGTKAAARALQAEKDANQKLTGKVNQLIIECGRLEEERDKLASNARFFEQIGEYHKSIISSNLHQMNAQQYLLEILMEKASPALKAEGIDASVLIEK